MDTIFFNSENSKTSEPHVLILQLADKLDLIRDESIDHTWKNMKSLYNNKNFKISGLTWNDKLELPDESYSISDIQDYFRYILKKHNEKIDNPSIRIYINKPEKRNTFYIKTEYYLDLLTPETMQILGSTENKITKDKNGENVLHFEIAEIVLVHCIIVNNGY